ncbi:ABC transporter substrate-binding protein [Clostridium boliviensis]|uniref:ABC transporter substrate-binding protein n=1 Tax=Clostridium boliviensis TaxID=318465 RepID=A0ABU4GGN0_9CLOT|nr:ABC transporter substrate-binding protein [Clostridium boliviensis]MDW2796780.1 ABC transporter substrate-binding protein [Clostridium boliviensis]
MNFRLMNITVLIMILTSLLSGCTARIVTVARNETEDQTGYYQFTDALGQEIRVKNPQRVVALMGSFADTWQKAGGELCGVTEDAFEERGLVLPENVISVGMYNSPNLENIIALNPDLVILSSETKEHTALKEAFNQAGITAAYFNVTYFEDYLSMLRICTEITGREDLYKKNGLDTKQKIEDVIKKSIPGSSPRVLFLITYSGGVVAKNSECMTGRMLRDLGCINLADENKSLLKEFSMEAIIKEDPDYIFVVPMGNDEAQANKNLKESIENNPAWNGLKAVQNQHYILLSKEKFLYKPNEKWGESYDYLSEILSGSR